MRLTTTSVFEKIVQAWINKKRHIWIEGGTWASKTWSVIQWLYLTLEHSKSPLIASIVSESIPHVKRGCLRDFKDVLSDSYDESRMNKTDLIYTFDKAMLEFFSADDPTKQRGARRDILFVNEANNIPYDAFRELDSRTKRCTVADWNPTHEFWFHENKLADDPDSEYIHCTYLDALNVIPQDVVKNILAMGERDPNWKNVYLRGLLGKVEGLVYPFFEQIDELPPGGMEGYGLDFGYSNDPTVLTRNVIKNDGLFSDELIYERGLTNPMIADRMIEKGIRPNYDEIWADSAEPKSIEEIYQRGFNIKPCPKGADSVEFGHQKVRQYKQYWTKRSLNCIKEQRNFRYIADKDNRLTEKTIHQWSHGMDSRRYWVIGAMGTHVIDTILIYDAMKDMGLEMDLV